MTTSWKNSRREGCGVQAGELFNVILVYEDQASASRGLALYQRLVTDLGGEDDFNLNVWKFAVLGVGRLAEISAQQATEADLIIVCPRDESEPPEDVQAWFQRWADVKGQSDYALVVLSGNASPCPVSAGSNGFFRGMARRGHVAVFSSTAVHDVSTARTNECCWFPQNSRASAVDGWAHHGRFNSPTGFDQPSLGTSSHRTR